MNNPTVIAVVLDYKRPFDTIECIRSIKASTLSAKDILVVDNASADNSWKTLQQQYPEVVVINSGGNLGYAGGMNVGITKALEHSPDFLAIMNSDVILDKYAIEKLVKQLEIIPATVAAAGTIYYENNHDRIWHAKGKVNYWRASGFTNNHLSNQHNKNGNQFVSFLSGCVMVVKASVFLKGDYFDEHYFMYLEDVEFSTRLIQQGHLLLYVPGAIFYHKINSGQVTVLQLYYSVRNRMLFISTYAPPIQKIIGCIYLFVTMALKICYWFILFRYRFIKATVYGFVDFAKKRFGPGRGLLLANTKSTMQKEIQ